MKYKALGSIENRFREAYNKGYKDGLRDGASQVTAKLVSKILEDRMTEEEFDTMIAKSILGQTDCYDYSKSEMENIKCGNGITTEIPQTDCGWGEPITVSHNEDKED